MSQSDSIPAEAVEAAAKARFEDMYCESDDPQWDEIDPVERQEWRDAVRVALAAAWPHLEAQVRARIAEEIEAQAEKCGVHWPMPTGDCWVCQRHGMATRAVRIARGRNSRVAQW